MPKGSKPKDLTGKRFGKLVAQLIIGKGAGGNMIWLCQCDCGNTCQSWQGSLKKGKAKCCGKRGCVNTKKDAAFRRVLHSYTNSARRKGQEFDLSEELFRELTKGLCFYCGDPPSRKATTDIGQIYVFNGIDRKNNNLGYTKDNCVSCCSDCNYFKRARSDEEFVSKIKKIFFYIGAQK